MSREIKFRVWDIDNKEFVYISETIDGEIWINNGLSTVEMPTHKEPYEQYTGLKDKNGIEIYEGDIIRETISEDGITDGTYEYEVCWDEDLLCWSLNGISDIYHMRNDLWETNASREVIGNIHENPELLESK